MAYTPSEQQGDGAATTMHVSSAPPRLWIWQPPGLLFYLAVGFAVFLGIWVSSGQSFGWLLVAMPVWFLIAGIWGGRLIGAAVASRLRMGLGEWVRWLAVPIILGGVYIWTQSGGPFDLRLSLSRSAMDEAAAEVMAGGTTDRGWIGLWPSEEIERLPGGMRFIVSECGFINRCGFAWSADGSSDSIADPNDYEDSYERLDANWFIWVDGF